MMRDKKGNKTLYEIKITEYGTPQPLALVGKKENVREDVLLYVGPWFSVANPVAVETTLTPMKQRTLEMCKLKS